MTVPAFWNADWTAALVNHLWQSTGVIGVAWLLTLALRRNHARARYLVWMATSLKFLLPFSLLMDFGEWLRHWVPTAVPQSAMALVVEQVAQPFAQTNAFYATGRIAAQHTNWLPNLLLSVWACGVLIVVLRVGRGWWRVYLARRGALPLEVAADVPVLSTPTPIEPGIFGIIKPVLLLPEGIQERLTAEQMRAILAHEMCHVRRRDNLTFAIHMLVEVLFWFHPMVWWIGAQLIKERECACDEAVVGAGCAARTYAEGIINICKFYVESPVACVSGVSGSDLKKRIMRIMAEQVAQKLSMSGQILIGTVALLAVAAPIAIGLVYTVHGHAQQQDADTPPIHFVVASIRQNISNDGKMIFHAYDDGVVITGAPVVLLVQQAFGVQGDRIVGLPAWSTTDRYDIQAKVDDADVPRWKTLKMTRSKIAFQELLASRFAFKAHSETRQHPVYSLVVAKGGPKLHEAKPGDTYPNGLKKEDGTPLGPAMIVQSGKIVIQAGGMAALVRILSFRGLGYPVEDRTGLSGVYDMTVQWTPAEPGSTDDPNSSLFTALEEQLGLKLQLEKRPVEMIIVDDIKKPSAN